MTEPGRNGERPGTPPPGEGREVDEGASPEARATIEALRRGLRAEGAPPGFTERVMRRVDAAREPARPLEPARRAPRRPVSSRTIAIAAAAAWLLSFFIGMTATDDSGRRHGATALVRRTGGGDPRAAWVKLDLLAALSRAKLIDGVLGSGEKSGYRFEAYWDGEDPRHWWVIASPQSPSAGTRYFYIDDTGVIRFETGKVPTSRSPALGG